MVLPRLCDHFWEQVPHPQAKGAGKVKDTWGPSAAAGLGEPAPRWKTSEAACSRARSKGRPVAAPVHVCGEEHRFGGRWPVSRSWRPSPGSVRPGAGGFAFGSPYFFIQKAGMARAAAPRYVVRTGPGGVGAYLGQAGWGHHGAATTIITGVITVILGKIASHRDWCSSGSGSAMA